MEILVVFFLIALAASVTGIKIKKTLDEQQFLNEVQQIVGHLQMAQDMMLIMNRDIEVRYSVDPKTKLICYALHPSDDKVFNNSKFIKERQELKSIKWLEFGDQHISANKMDEIKLKFSSKGFSMSRGILTVSNTDQRPSERSEGFQILLTGFPRYINSQSHQASTQLPDMQSKMNLYPSKLLEEK